MQVLSFIDDLDVLEELVINVKGFCCSVGFHLLKQNIYCVCQTSKKHGKTEISVKHCNKDLLSLL